MAASTTLWRSHSRKTTTSGQKYKGSYNVVSRLHTREVHGSLQSTKYNFPAPRSVFGKIPGRLCIPLKYIVDAETLIDEGHVFLGFTKDGQFILSYTLRVEANEHTALPVYVYRLYWWLFKYYQPMVKVSEVRLFGEEEIQDDLYIAVCSWPTDASKVFVYGSCPSGGNCDEKRQCYVTITAVPPTSPCKECINFQTAMKSQNNNIYNDEIFDSDTRPSRCLKHGFVVHTKYELSPPFPLFAPKYSLKRDGLAVINTGYSLIALGVKVYCGSAATSTQSSLYSTNNTATNTQTSTDSEKHSFSSQGYISSPEATLHGLKSYQDRLSTIVQGVRNTAVGMEQWDANTGAFVTMQACQDTHTAKEQPSLSGLPILSQSQESTYNQEYSISTSDTKATSHSLFDAKDCMQSTCANRGFKRNDNNIAQMTCKVTEEGEKKMVQIHSDLVNEETSDAHLNENEEIFSSLLTEVKYSMVASTSQGSQIDDSDATNLSSISDKEEVFNQAMENSPRVSLHDDDEGTVEKENTNANKYRKSSRKRKNEQVRNRVTVARKFATVICSQGSDLGDFDLTSPNLCSQDDSRNLLCDSWNHKTHDKTDQKSMKSMPEGIPVERECVLGEDNFGCEIDQSCPIHGATTINLSWSINSVSDLEKCTCQQRGFNYSVRRYVDCVPETDSPLDIEDEFHSMLPLEVHGANHSLMTRTRRSPDIQGQYIEVKQLTMDAEQYISETVRSHAKWKDRYLDFTDYDMQILDVSIELVALHQAFPRSTSLILFKIQICNCPM
uniref:Uncharacterized protein LOC102805067 n=1 Tax=Saccoglossus kowalevskii TaxID=10224 RepID=A0ABM0LXW5_SACKO|nr:PREDICTED: uncharacterized protein LOC102805067 [Saccoglossus kowalevskii]